LKVLLTGANGFVGSHILDNLSAQNIPTRILLRSTSDPAFIASHLSRVEVCQGSVCDRSSVLRAVDGVTHVIHCAGLTKAVRTSEFYEVNQTGTRNVIDAVNESANKVSRLVHLSSLAAAGPAGADNPAKEQDAPRPVSTYGKSKLAAELDVRNHCRQEFVILRPPGVYGPRDAGFLPMFTAVKRHLLPRPKASQALSLVFVRDLALAVCECLHHAAAAGKTYFVAAREVVTGCGMAEEIAAQMRRWTLPCALPATGLWTVCLAQELISRITGRARMLSLQKFPELCASGWVCDPGLMERDLGFVCKTPLKEGISATLDWYNKSNWL
jgi:nucleoside-diphosphate-sugar epimerase